MRHHRIASQHQHDGQFIKTLTLELLILRRNQPEIKKSTPHCSQLMNGLDFRLSSAPIVSRSHRRLKARPSRASRFVKFQAELYEVLFNH